MESRSSSRRHKEEGVESEKKKVKKGILKNSNRNKLSDYDVPGHLSSSCSNLLQEESGSTQMRDKGRRKHREVEDIYDTPKVTSVKWREDLEAAYDMLRAKHGVPMPPESSCFYENVGFNTGNNDQRDEDTGEGVYDYPRPRAGGDTVYFNDNFDDDVPTYDTPRRQTEEFGNYTDQDIDEVDECNYDVPKVRDAVLETIEEEESQEYDIPRNNKLIQPDNDENLYENQQFVNNVLNEPIYMNEIQDDHSSGYRSSSSPSINSEENLYENGALLMDDFSSQGSQVIDIFSNLNH